MHISEIMGYVDHTVLAPDATWEDIAGCVDDAAQFGCATAMVPPFFVKRAVEYSAGRIPVATVIGFPHGNSTTVSKAFEAAEAVMDGASEIDMVANISMVKEGDFEAVSDDIRAVKAAVGKIPLKVIIECCLLEDDEKRKMCRVCADAGADYIKTSTGFSRGGATLDDVELLVSNAPEGLLVKAAGGISGFGDAEAFLGMGAARLGTSRLVKTAKEMKLGR